MHTCHFHDYYVNQAGTGVGAIYKGVSYQRGHGFGGFLRGLFRSVMPLLKSGAKTIGKEALRSGASFIGDIINEVPVREAFNSRVNESVVNLKRKAENKIDNLVGSGAIKRQRFQNKNHIRRKSRSVKKSALDKHQDIFS